MDQTMTKNNVCIRAFADMDQIKSCRQKILEREESLFSVSKVLALAGNSTRLKMLYLLSIETELCPCDLSDILQMTVPAISQHLRKLRDANMVKSRKVGQTVFYSLKEDHYQIIEPLFYHINEPMTSIA